MIFKRVNRTLAESVFVVFQANEASIAADDVVALELTAASVDGVKIAQPSTSPTGLNAVVGIADAAISNGAYGLVQVYGYRSTSRVNASGTSMAAGFHLIPVGGSDHLAPLDTVGYSKGMIGNFVLLESAASSAGAASTVSAKIFIRCM